MKKCLMLLLGMFAATVAVADEGRAFSRTKGTIPLPNGE